MKMIHLQVKLLPIGNRRNEYYIENVGLEYVTYGSYVVASVEESGATNGTLTLSRAVAVANSYNVNVSVNAQIITAAVGYNRNI